MCCVRWGGAVLTVLPRVFMIVCSRLRLAVVQGPRGFPTRRTRALRRALGILSTRDACAAWASVSVRMAGCNCSPSASARIWWIAKAGHRLVAPGISAVRSRWGDGLQLLPVVQVEPQCRRPFPGVRPAAPRPLPEAVEGMAWVPGASCPRYDGR